MNRYATIFGWLVVGLTALVIVNLVFFGIVVGLDIAFGEAPEFAVPTFVPVLICIVTWIMFFIWRRRTKAQADTELECPLSVARTAAGDNSRPQESLLRSVLVIRRRSTSHVGNQKKGAYETSI